MQGFIVKQPYSDQIISGKKKFEYRNFKTKKINEPCYLLSEGFVLGTIMFTGIKEINKDWRYSWRIMVIKKLKQPWKYNHPMGAQRWVKSVVKKIA
jgi:hypothetical protein